MILRRCVRSALWSALAVAAATDAAPLLHVTDHGCARGVELVAQDVPLREVLERLSQTLGFRLEVEGELAGTVRMRATAPASRLLTDLLASQQGHVLWHARDPRCPQHARVSRVRLVAGPSSASAPPAAAAPGPVTALPSRVAPVTEVGTPERLREVERESQRRKAQYDAYVRRHGEPPPGEPEDAARP